jgi:hypothetical protein
MTRKHFQRLADAVWIASQTSDFSESQLNTLIGALADACKEANARFDKDRFSERCREGWK